jgi:hypothetical protein
VAYKNAVGSRRTAWRTISAIQNKEEYKVMISSTISTILTIESLGLKILGLD